MRHPAKDLLLSFARDVCFEKEANLHFQMEFPGFLSRIERMTYPLMDQQSPRRWRLDEIVDFGKD